jgi:hypothetical protein
VVKKFYIHCENTYFGHKKAQSSELYTQTIKQAVSMVPSEVLFVGFGSMEGTFPFRIGGHLVQYFSVLVW